MLIRGFDMSKVTDGAQFVLQHPVVIQRTYSYTAASGSEKTVLVLERNESELTKLAEPAVWFAENVRKQIEDARKAAEEARYRNWTDSTGEFSIAAKFIEFKSDQVHLERKDNRKTIEVPISRLSEEDQKWVRDEIKRRRGGERKAAATKSTTKNARGR